MLRPLDLARDLLVDDQNEAIRQVVFPVRCVISTVARFLDGDGIEVGFAGHEGMSALALAFGSDRSPHQTIVQIAGPAYAIDAAAFTALLGIDAELRARALHYAQYVFIACAQFAGCNRLHPVSERYARWLLMAHDRIGRSEFNLTQEYCAQMLGVRRASVTLVAGEFSTAGMIEYQRGIVRVLDRSALESMACECYARVNSELFRLMGYGARQGPAAL